MNDDELLLINVTVAPVSDLWGSAGIVTGDVEVYRGVRACPGPGGALQATRRLLSDVLGALGAGPGSDPHVDRSPNSHQG